MVSPERANEIVAALRRGTVPQRSLDAFAVGLSRFEQALDEELLRAKKGKGEFKAVRGEYGSGKTFFSRWLQDRARQHGFATSEVQISESETPLHKHQTIYRRLIERLSTSDTHGGAFRTVIDGWFFALEEDVLAEGKISEDDAEALFEQTNELMERRLASLNSVAPSFSLALRGYRKATMAKEPAIAEGLLAWLGGQPNVAAQAKRYAGIKGDVDHDTALNFLQGLLLVLRDAGHAGLLLVLDEVETLQRVRRDVRDKGLNALRQLLDELDQGRFPGLYIAITGTPAFYDGPQGVQRLTPLAQRLHTDFKTASKFDNPRDTQIRLPGFDEGRLTEVGRKVRDLYVETCKTPARVTKLANDDYVADLARAVTGELGGKVGIAPRVFLKKLVAEVLDRIDQFDDFDPRRDYALTVSDSELSDVERNARAASDPDDIELSL
jgi:bacteriophage exclusion system BrxC/D-like protein